MQNAQRLNDDTLDRLVAMVNDCCLVALNKALNNIGATTRNDMGYQLALSRLVNLRDKMEQASIEVGKCLPKKQS